MTIECLDHIAVRVEDIEKSLKWYAEHLDIEIKYQDKTWALASAHGTDIAFVTQQHHPPHVAFKVNNIEDLGGKHSTHRDGSHYIYKKDPDGNIIELIYWKEK